MTVYLDCNATTPIEPSVFSLVARFLEQDYGNPASPVHDYGVFARMAVEHARGQVAEVVKARRDEIIFTSGATEANNLALLGLLEHGLKENRHHIIATGIEHKAVLEPLAEMTRLGFEVELLPVGPGGRLDPQRLHDALRPDTLLVTTMHVNNETGIIQPLQEISEVLTDHPAMWHVDAAQGFGKDILPLQDQRIDLISVSGHKIYGPKGVGALVARKGRHGRPALRPLMFGGGQEQGLRPGTLAVPLIVGLGEAAKLAAANHEERASSCRKYRAEVMKALEQLEPEVNGDQRYALPHTINVSLHRIPSDRAIAAVKKLIAVSSTSACTSHTRTPSHVLEAMGLPHARIETSLRFSWCHLTPPADWNAIVEILRSIQGKEGT